jgi:hypothetical protein
MLYDKRWDKPEVKSDNETVTALLTARGIVSDPKKWTCGDYAKDSYGRWVGTTNPSAVSFCSVGALAVAMGVAVREAEDSGAGKYLVMAAREQGCEYAHDLNDKGHASALAMFDRAIELARCPQESGS